MNIAGARDRGVNVDAAAEATAAAPVVDHAAGVGRGRGDVLLNVGLRGVLRDVFRGEARGGETLEDVVDEFGDVLGVAGVRVVDCVGGAGDEVLVEDDGAGGEEARGAVDVEGDGFVVVEVGVAGGIDGSLETGDAAIIMRDGGPEDRGLGCKGVGTAAGVQVECCVACGRRGVGIGV